jgi:hypothetical protein
MLRFSQRIGIKEKEPALLRNSISKELRNNLWNGLKIFYWDYLERTFSLGDRRFAIMLWMDYFKLPLDHMPNIWENLYSYLIDYYFKCEWYEVYDFIEFCAQYYPKNYPEQTSEFVAYCNVILQEEGSAYRFIDGVLTPLTSEEEIAEVSKALEDTDSITSVKTHLKTAQKRLSDKKEPDYRNSMKESISAVEAICKLIVNSDKATLGEALKIIDSKIDIHPALKSAFDKLFGYTSSADGIRHAQIKESALDIEDAQFMLVSCSAFINYLIAKSSKAGIELRKKK